MGSNQSFNSYYLEMEYGKLIELLNEYEIEKEKSEGVNVDAYVEFKWDYNNHNGLVRYDETDRWEGDNLYGDVAVAYLISKKFGMVKWLVENDKIDLLRLDNRIALSEFNKVERVLMALSISSSPIEDLISYLK